MNAVASNPSALEEREGFEPSVLSLVRLISSPTCEQRMAPEPAWMLENWLRIQCAKRPVRALLDNIPPTTDSEAHPPTPWRGLRVGISEKRIEMNHKTLTVPLGFHAVGSEPPKGSSSDTFLLYNPCDGLHIAYGRWYAEGGFAGFFDFLGKNEYGDDFYDAWAMLPDCNDVLFPVFATNPSRASIAYHAIKKANPTPKEPEA